MHLLSSRVKREKCPNASVHVSLCIQSECGKKLRIWTFLRSEYIITENVKHLRIRANYLTKKDFQKTTANEKIL